MNIRALQQADFDTVLSMMEVFYASDALLIHPDTETLRRTLGDALQGGRGVDCFVLETAMGLAGYAMMASSYSTERGGKCVWIEDIYILPQFRHMGYGSRVLAFAAEHYPDAVRLRLEAEPGNENAMAAYRKAGFEILGYTQLVKEREL